VHVQNKSQCNTIDQYFFFKDLCVVRRAIQNAVQRSESTQFQHLLLINRLFLKNAMQQTKKYYDRHHLFAKLATKTFAMQNQSFIRMIQLLNQCTQLYT
jgi:hypothetical protein